MRSFNSENEEELSSSQLPQHPKDYSQRPEFDGPCVTHNELILALSLLAREASNPSIFGGYRGQKFHQQLTEFTDGIMLPNPHISQDIQEKEEEEEERKSDGDTIQQETEHIEALTVQQQIDLTNIIIQRLTGAERHGWGPSLTTRFDYSQATRVMHFLVNCILSGPDIDDNYNHPIKETLIDLYSSMYSCTQVGKGYIATVTRTKSFVIKKIRPTKNRHEHGSRRQEIVNEIMALQHLSNALGRETGAQRKKLLPAFSLPICVPEPNATNPQIVFWAANMDLRMLCRKEYSSLNSKEEEGKEAYFLRIYKKLANTIYNALLFMHENGMVHRDLKLENILVMLLQDGDFLFKITDVGSSTYEFIEDNRPGEQSREIGSAPFQAITVSCTSPTMLHHYMSHASWADRTHLERNDLWALICMIADAYYMLTTEKYWLVAVNFSSDSLLQYIDTGTDNPATISALFNEMHTYRQQADIKALLERGNCQEFETHCDKVIGEEEAYNQFSPN